MNTYEIQGSFGLDHLVRVDRAVPAPGARQVVLRMRCSSLNYRDLMTVLGSYNPKQPLPLVPCSDGVGEVVAVGDGVSRVKVGDRVCPIFAQGWLSGEPTRDKLRSTLGGPLPGVLTEHQVFDQEGLVQVPAYLSDEEAACLPCAAVTAWTALVTEGGLRAGDTVLLQGTGGVATFGLQIARLHGATAIVTSKSDEKLDRARALGAAVGINYLRQPDWARAVRTATGGRGVDHVLELGGAATLAQSLQCVRPGGRIAVIGVLSGMQASLPVTALLMSYVRIQGILVGHRESFEAMARAFEAAALRPVIDRVFPLGEAREAFGHLASGAHQGKVVVRIQP
jgi:NADPH:quinone reductase-like Zn-dependent oxidoreductase